ncbi:hypothetical protein M408DRAFT_169859 [Serendipita vermifera MAFF 305830]|uniref:Uncharacterized protein n=1 Tax=Serendipita vermifera MAFF 305830 TaxID=933852 RepID=A0A0C3B7I1_SERVB|nr:hypothetical protein M408DRAFT_169859 [Serendipita vermifera MAFF 305830]
MDEAVSGGEGEGAVGREEDIDGSAVGEARMGSVAPTPPSLQPTQQAGPSSPVSPVKMGALAGNPLPTNKRVPFTPLKGLTSPSTAFSPGMGSGSSRATFSPASTSGGTRATDLSSTMRWKRTRTSDPMSYSPRKRARRGIEASDSDTEETSPKRKGSIHSDDEEDPASSKARHPSRSASTHSSADETGNQRREGTQATFKRTTIPAAPPPSSPHAQEFMDAGPPSPMMDADTPRPPLSTPLTPLPTSVVHGTAPPTRSPRATALTASAQVMAVGTQSGRIVKPPGRKHRPVTHHEDDYDGEGSPDETGELTIVRLERKSDGDRRKRRRGTGRGDGRGDQVHTVCGPDDY